MLRITRREFLVYGTSFGCVALVSEPFSLLPTGIGVAMIGLGERGLSHLRALHSMHARITAICDSNPRRMAAAMSSIPESSLPPVSYSDYRRILDRQDVDLVAVSVPPPDRLLIVDAAVRAGKNVVVEQPAATLSDALRLKDLAKRFSVSIEHIPSDPEWDREGLVELLLTDRLGKVDRVEIHDVRADLPTRTLAPCVDALEVAADILSARMPRRAVALTASGITTAWNTSAEIELETSDGRGYLASHVLYRALPRGLERSITFTVEGDRGSARTVVESWRKEGTTNQPPIHWVRALNAANVYNREHWSTTAARMFATCAIVETLEQARMRGVVTLSTDSNYFLEKERF